jgi:hypothetical protein
MFRHRVVGFYYLKEDLRSTTHNTHEDSTNTGGKHTQTHNTNSLQTHIDRQQTDRQTEDRHIVLHTTHTTHTNITIVRYIVTIVDDR